MLRRKQRRQQEGAAPKGRGAAPRARALKEDTALEQVVLGKADDAFKAALGDPQVRNARAKGRGGCAMLYARGRARERARREEEKTCGGHAAREESDARRG